MLHLVFSPLLMKRYKFIPLFIFCLAGTYAQSAPPFVSYAGQVASGGQPYQGTGQFKFAFVNAAGDATYWSQDGTSTSGSEPTGFVSTQVNGGYYSILLGNTAISGMGAIDPSIFKTYSDVHLRVWFSNGVAAFEELSPHRPFASVPYALNAGVAAGEITANQLSEQVLKYFKPELIQSPQAPANVYAGQHYPWCTSPGQTPYLPMAARWSVHPWRYQCPIYHNRCQRLCARWQLFTHD